MKSIELAAFVVITALPIACSSGSGSGSTGGDGGSSGEDSGAGGSGMTTVTCYSPNATTPMCNASSVPSQYAGLQEKDCSTTGSHPGTVVSACPTQGLSGCCTMGASKICYYGGGAADNGCPAAEWTGESGSDAGVEDAGTAGTDTGAGGGIASFVGTWSGMFSDTETCPTGSPTMNSRSDTLVISLGSGGASAGVVSVLYVNGCKFNFMVSGQTATALPNQVCAEMKDGSTTEDITDVSRTLTLDDGTLTASGSVTIAKSGVSCTEMESGTYSQ